MGSCYFFQFIKREKVKREKEEGRKEGRKVKGEEKDNNIEADEE